jgi:ABC-2 type transport system permease protein
VKHPFRLFGHYVRFNLRAGMEYRASFAAQVFGMVLNNGSFIVFWLILYTQLPSIQGYAFGDVMFLWALSATGYGLAGVFLGNAGSLSRSIITADLDVYLLQPAPLLPNFLLSRMSISAWGDILYGVVLYAFTQPFAPGQVALFLLFSLLMAGVLTALRVLWHSLTFLLGNAEDFAAAASEMVLSFSLYPGSIFQGGASVLLHSLVPAALIAYIPVELFKDFSAGRLLLLLAADAAVCAVAWVVFRLGLRVYESGSRMGARV